MKIFLADDHQLFLEGMQSILIGIDPKIDIEFAYNGNDALKMLSKTNYDVALVDLRLPGLDGFSLLSELSKINCLVPIIIVTASEDPDDLKRAIDLGALGFVPKSSTGQQIIDTIKAVLNGEIVISNDDQRRQEKFEAQSNWARLHNITPRQLEVLRLMRIGLTNQAIAERLFLSTATVKTHIVTIFQTLGTKNRTETIEKIRQLGLD